MKEQSLKDLLLQAPDGHLDKSAIDSIKEWDEEPKAIQVLKTLDMCVHSGLASGFVISVLEQLLNHACREEKTTYPELIEKAVWRQS
jgi:hypothetical protein